MRAPRLLGLSLAIAVAAPTVAAAGTKPPLPAAGKWNIGTAGHYTVGKSRTKISGLTMPDCNGATVKVLGKQKLSITSRGGYTNWIVGKSTPKTSNGVTPIKVKLVEAGKKGDGTLSIIFAVGGDPRTNYGSLDTPDCGQLDVTSAHA